jgi:zinc protease
VQRVADTYLIDSNLTVGTFIPADKPVRAVITAAPNIDTLLAGYAGNAAAAAGEDFAATPQNIEARTRRGMAGSLKTAFLVKKSRGDRVSGVISLNFGSAGALQGKADIGNLTAAMLMRGTQLHSRQQIQDELTRLKATLNVGGYAAGLTASFETTQPNLGETLALIAEALQKPAFPADDLEEIKRDNLSRIDAARTDPNAIAGLTLRRALSPYPPQDFRYVATLDERTASIKTISVGDLHSFYKQFYGAGNAEAALVGNFDAAAVARQLTELFGAWKSPSPFQRAVGIYKPTEQDSKTIVTPDKANAILLAGTLIKIRDDDPDYPALRVGNEILGGGFGNSRLATRIREKEGLSYSVGSQLKADSQDRIGSLTIFAISAPQNTVKAETDVKEEIARILASGGTAAEIGAAKSGILQSMTVARSSDAALARDLADHLFLNRDFTWDAALERNIAAATPAAIHGAMQRLIVPSQFMTVKAGDFKDR